jgi:diguanylate cyclase (GGDEF)-like protein
MDRAAIRGLQVAETPRRVRPARVWHTCLVVVAVLALTAAVVGQLHHSNRSTDAHHFDVLKEKLRGEILRRVNVYRYGLMGTRSVFAASERVGRAEFRQLFEARELANEFPAATGIGYINRVGVSNLPAFLQRVRADEAPDFSIRMLADRVLHDELFVITYLEPEAGNEQAIGLDIGQESRRRAAAERAMREGDVALTEQITLVQATGAGPGFLILLPHYADDQHLDTVEAREESLVGWVYMTILAEKVFTGANARINHELDFRVFDGHDMSPQQLLYSGVESTASDDSLTFEDRPHREVLPVEIGGRQWMVAMGSSDRFKASSNVVLWGAAIGGVVLAVLLALLLQVQASSLSKAEELAHQMTLDLREIALTDRLTHLPNRAAILDRVQQAIHRADRVPAYHYALLFLDFDRFKVINDSLGHAAGDQLLRQIGERLQRTLRRHDCAALGTDRNTAARLGGDEFIVLLDGLARPEDAEVVAARLLDVLGEPYQLQERAVSSSASIGVVHGEARYRTADEVICDADIAMYEAKTDGRGTYKVFDTDMRAQAEYRLNLENDLREAIDRQEFHLHYQPILALEQGRVASFEALVRWNHPALGAVAPNRFIPLAEEAGLIVPIGAWVLDEALRQFAVWRKDGTVDLDCAINVNLSRKRLVLPGLFEQVSAALHRHRVPPDRLHLEVTENIIMQDPDIALQNLHRLRNLGVHIDLDDFGTGHSSLACLHDFPVDTLKIDRSFVANLASDPGLVIVLRAVTELAESLGVSVVAEGIETPEQLELLKQLYCPYGQGYLFSRPLPPEDVASLAPSSKNPRRSAA